MTSGGTRFERNRSNGVPGATFTMMNEMTLIPMMIGMAWSSRRRM